MLLDATTVSGTFDNPTIDTKIIRLLHFCLTIYTFLCLIDFGWWPSWTLVTMQRLHNCLRPTQLWAYLKVNMGLLWFLVSFKIPPSRLLKEELPRTQINC